jgi:hypothetical protein
MGLLATPTSRLLAALALLLLLTGQLSVGGHDETSEI